MKGGVDKDDFFGYLAIKLMSVKIRITMTVNDDNQYGVVCWWGYSGRKIKYALYGESCLSIVSAIVILM